MKEKQVQKAPTTRAHEERKREAGWWVVVEGRKEEGELQEGR
jgi:hypothetical protein